MTNDKTIEKRLLDALFCEAKVLWTLGDTGATIQIFSELKDKTNLFNLSFYEDQENEPTVRYLKEHSMKDILAGRNPDMIPEKVCIVGDGNGVVEVHFRRSKKLQDAKVDDVFYLNRDLENPRFGVIVTGDNSEKYVVGYSDTEKQEPYIKTYHDNDTISLMTFTVASL